MNRENMGILNKLSVSIKEIYNSIVQFFCSDWEGEIANWYKNINPLYKKTFIITYIFANIIFAYHTVNFMWGNHDWPFALFGLKYNSFAFEARFTETLHYALFNWKLLPIVNNLFQIAGLTLSSIAVAYYFKVPKKLSCYLLFTFFLTSIPLNFVNFYHVSQSGFDWIAFVIASAFTLYTNNLKSKHFVGVNFLVFLLITYALGAYATYISTIIVLIIGRFLIEYIIEKRSFRDYINDNKFLFLDISISCIVTRLIIKYIQSFNPESSTYYNTQTIGLNEAAPKLLDTLTYSIQQFIQSVPFINGNYQILLISLALVALGALIYRIPKKGIIGAIIATLAILILLLGSETAIYISKNQNHLEFLSRITKCGLLYVYGLSAAIVLIISQSGNFYKNATAVLLIVLIQLGTVNQIECIKTFKLGYDAEMRLWDSIVNRIESDKNFHYAKQYRIIILGEKSLRPYYYINNSYKEYDATLLFWSCEAHWLFEHFFKFRYPLLQVSSTHSSESAEDKGLPLNRNIINFIMKKAEPWPSQNSIMVKDNDIVIALDANSIASTRQFIINKIDKIKYTLNTRKISVKYSEDNIVDYTYTKIGTIPNKKTTNK